MTTPTRANGDLLDGLPIEYQGLNDVPYVSHDTLRAWLANREQAKAPATLPEDWKTELLDWVSACQAAYHIDSTPNHCFGGIDGQLEENRTALVGYVEELLAVAHATQPVGNAVDVLTLNEIWQAAGGNPGIKPTKNDVLEALRQLDQVCDEAEQQQALTANSESDTDGRNLRKRINDVFRLIVEEAEEYDFDDGLGVGITQRIFDSVQVLHEELVVAQCWGRFQDALDVPQPSKTEAAVSGHAYQLLVDLAKALDEAFISSWQSSSRWQKELDAALEYINAQQSVEGWK